MSVYLIRIFDVRIFDPHIWSLVKYLKNCTFFWLLVKYLKNCIFLNILRFALFFALFWHPNPPHLNFFSNFRQKNLIPPDFFSRIFVKKSETEKFFWAPPNFFCGTPRKFSGYPQIFFRIFVQKKSL